MAQIVQVTDRDATRSMGPSASGRDRGIDFLRFLLCFAVAMLHTMMRADVGTPPLWVVIAASLCRGAVPFFFIASGFFARVPDRIGWQFLARPISRIIPVYLMWTIIYYALDWYATGRPAHLGLREFLTGGVALHLWFLPALGFAMIAVPILLIKTGRTVTWLICLALAGINLAFVGYRDVFHLPEIAGTRAMIAPLLFLLGMELVRHRPAIKLYLATCAMVAAWALTFAEEWMIAHFARVPLLSHSSVGTTYIFGAAIFLFAKALPEHEVITHSAKLGAISLGVYASHLIFVRFFIGTIGNATLASSLATAAAAISASTILCLMLTRLDLTRRFVR